MQVVDDRELKLLMIVVRGISKDTLMKLCTRVRLLRVVDFREPKLLSIVVRGTQFQLRKKGQ